MPTPTVNIHDDRVRTRFVLCPICSTNTYLARDQATWAHHMEREHGAGSDSWSGNFSGIDIHAGGYGPKDVRGMDSDNLPTTYAYICYGCGSSFATKAELVTHLSDTHSAS